MMILRVKLLPIRSRPVSPQLLPTHPRIVSPRWISTASILENILSSVSQPALYQVRSQGSELDLAIGEIKEIVFILPRKIPILNCGTLYPDFDGTLR